MGWPLLVPSGYRAEIIQVKPGGHAFNWFSAQNDQDFSVWLVQDAMSRKVTRPLRQVRQGMRESVRLYRRYKGKDASLMADVFLVSALHHPRTPLAIGYTNKHRPELGAFVSYRGELFDRLPDGSLKPWGERDPSVPTSEEWFSHFDAAQDFLKQIRGRS